MFAILAQTDASPVDKSQMWVLVGLASVAIIYVAILRPMMRRKKDPLERPPAFASLSKQRDVERQMQNLLVELSEMSRQITAQLDTRAQKLELLLGEADRKIADLKAASENGSRPYAFSSDAPPKMANLPCDDARHAEVYALADQGRDAGEIASNLHRPRGEVELILALRSKD